MATILLNYLGRKGAGPVFAYESAKYLKKSGHKVIALISSEIENFKMWQTSEIDELIPIKTYSNKVEFLINTISFLLLKRRKLIKKIKKENVEIIFCPMTHTWTYFINKKLKNIKKVVIVHDLQPHLGEYNLLLNLLNSLAYKNADYLIVLTKSFRELCAKKFKKNISNVFYMPHPRLEYYKFFEVERVSKSIYNEENVNFVFFGRISPYKGLNILAEAYREVKKKHRKCTLTIIGEGDFSLYADDYENLEDVRVINRWINEDEVYTFLKGKNLVGIAPYIEASQSGIIELFMTFGIPVIATKVGGIPEQVIHEFNGLLVEPNDYKDLANAMQRIIEDRYLYENMCRNIINEKKDDEWQYLNMIIERCK